MKLFIRQDYINFWHESFSVKDANNQEIFRVEPKKNIFTTYDILDKDRNILLTLKREATFWLPKFSIRDNQGVVLAEIQKKWTWFKAKYKIKSFIEGDDSDYSVKGSVMGWNFDFKRNDEVLCNISKKILKVTDTYCIDIKDDDEMLLCVAVALAIDNCQHDNKQKKHKWFS